jgi:hypothetical protein
VEVPADGSLKSDHTRSDGKKGATLLGAREVASKVPLDFLGCADVEVEVKKERLISQF